MVPEYQILGLHINIQHSIGKKPSDRIKPFGLFEKEILRDFGLIE